MADAHDAHGCVQDGHGDAVLVDGEDFVERSGVELLLRGEAHCHELHGEGDRIGPRSPAVLDGVPPADDEGILGDVRPHLRELAAHAGGHKPGFFVKLAAQDLTVNANQIFQIPGEGRARRPNDGHGIAFRRLLESRMRILTQGFGILDHAFLDGRFQAVRKGEGPHGEHGVAELHHSGEGKNIFHGMLRGLSCGSGRRGNVLRVRACGDGHGGAHVRRETRGCDRRPWGAPFRRTNGGPA